MRKTAPVTEHTPNVELQQQKIVVAEVVAEHGFRGWLVQTNTMQTKAQTKAMHLLVFFFRLLGTGTLDTGGIRDVYPKTSDWTNGYPKDIQLQEYTNKSSSNNGSGSYIPERGYPLEKGRLPPPASQNHGRQQPSPRHCKCRLSCWKPWPDKSPTSPCFATVGGRHLRLRLFAQFAVCFEKRQNFLHNRQKWRLQTGCSPNCTHSARGL